MYSTPDLFIDPPSPKKSAAAFHLASQEGRNKTKLDDPVTAGETHADWAVAEPNEACVSAWRGRLHKLGEQARLAASTITDAMDDYVDTDTSFGAELRKDADWLEGA
ncbi:hypothetical protein [Streptomyces sp. SAJ15]|uniref:hypothetical protein n=1 Tax=Streptomyces sp. SAJ15 TaxID=2011095 RepID=UPI001184FE09|nr:hypothetical protein [Streptomyces sp. SAJ15]TVL91737.1 hypothetical protein CD790_13560 [Streptomyces sp. SAJ15]